MRREPDPGEALIECARCGRVEVPLNERETWHYVRTGEGLCSDCPEYIAARGAPPCKWSPPAYLACIPGWRIHWLHTRLPPNAGLELPGNHTPPCPARPLNGSQSLHGTAPHYGRHLVQA